MEEDHRLHVIKTVCEEMKNGLFATKESPFKAYEFATLLINGMAPQDRIHALTALHVVLNSLAENFLKIIGDE